MKYLAIGLLSFIMFGFSMKSDQLGIQIYTVKQGFKNAVKDCNYCFDV